MQALSVGKTLERQARIFETDLEGLIKSPLDTRPIRYNPSGIITNG